MNRRTALADRDLEDRVAQARAGDRAALEEVLAAVQGPVRDMALRFLWEPADADDATQEILWRIARGLDGFRGRSRFRTWAYRIAVNTLRTAARSRAEREALSFEEFGEDLARGLSDDPGDTGGVEEALLLEEVKIGCTLAMLLCLNREQRLAYIVGDVLGLDHKEASRVLETSPSAYRQRLSRARRAVTSFLGGHCGLFDPANPCRCRRRVRPAIALGRLDPGELRFAPNAATARRFPRVLEKIRSLEETRRAAALYASQAIEPVDLVPRIRSLLEDE